MTPLMASCDRCGASEYVQLFTECPDCGPVPLCICCAGLHLIEMGMASFEAQP